MGAVSLLLALGAALLWRYASAVRYIAGATFTLYLLHMPIMLFVVAVLPWVWKLWSCRTVTCTAGSASVQ